MRSETFPQKHNIIPPSSYRLHSIIDYYNHTNAAAKEENAIIDEARLRCIAKCVFSLTEEEAQILTYLIRHNKRGIVKDIAEELDRNPEVVRRALRGLYMRSLVTRRPYPLRRGGRAYLYEVPQNVIEIVTKVCKYINEVINNNFKKNIREEGQLPLQLY